MSGNVAEKWKIEPSPEEILQQEFKRLKKISDCVETASTPTRGEREKGLIDRDALDINNLKAEGSHFQLTNDGNVWINYSPERGVTVVFKNDYADADDSASFHGQRRTAIVNLLKSEGLYPQNMP